MRVVARASLFNEKKSASVHELGRTGGTGPRTDPTGSKCAKAGTCSNDWKQRIWNFEIGPHSSRSRFKSCAMLAEPRSDPLAIACENCAKRSICACFLRIPVAFRISHRVGGPTSRLDAAVTVPPRRPCTKILRELSACSAKSSGSTVAPASADASRRIGDGVVVDAREQLRPASRRVRGRHRPHRCERPVVWYTTATSTID